ncbi:MAG: hypothetical protein IJH94_04550, partial [Clostridia bacterium]|nr:hypothetical protein [Clostridia bacterium]
MKISENVKNLIIVVVSIIAAALLVYFAAPRLLKIAVYLFGLLSPFAFGYLFARLINPLAVKLQQKIRLPKVVSVVLLIVLVLAAVVGIAG